MESTVTTYKAFASERAIGNPAGVIILPNPSDETAYDQNADFPYGIFPPASKLQEIATKLDYPMTAFAVPLANPLTHLMLLTSQSAGSTLPTKHRSVAMQLLLCLSIYSALCRTHPRR
ncbi:hypothetical protein NXS19_010782 [Fusarium pseudograminearum]|nr:hypothetical protein NXS19_010782 [Fusarium pseudograminearum]